MITSNAIFAKVLALLVAADGLVSMPASAPLAPSPAPLRYSLPWQLRPVAAENMVRIDTAVAAFNDAQGNLDFALPTVFAASYGATPHFAPTVRLGFVGNNAPGAALDGTSFVNPSVGVTYARSRGAYGLALFGATTLPLGTGGGAAPNLRAAETNAASMAARPVDAAMFAVNYVAAIAGADVAYVGHGFTAQVEVTLLQFVRVRGEDSTGAADTLRTQAAAGLHLGYFIGSHFSLSSDLHHRRWLSRPTSVSANPGARITFSDAGIDATTVAVGPRFHFRVGQRGWVRPGISLVRGIDSRGFDAPLVTAQVTAVQLDVPVTF